MKTLVIRLLTYYHKLISPAIYLIFGSGCKFYPTCSEYAKVSIERFGLIKGTVLSFKRLVRCTPLSRGFFDPVPDY